MAERDLESQNKSKADIFPKSQPVFHLEEFFYLFKNYSLRVSLGWGDLIYTGIEFYNAEYLLKGSTGKYCLYFC